MMNIITDNIEFTSKSGFGKTEDFALLKENSVLEITDTIFEKSKRLFSKTADIGQWSYLFVSEFSEKSQYDSIINLSQKINIPDKILCIAGSGKNFHGFHKRKWEALQGNIHLTVYFKPNKKIERLTTGFLILSAVSVVQAIDDIPQLKNKAQIKWVNDILIGNSKVSGVLAHSLTQGETVKGAILGIGINVETKPVVEATPFVPESACLNEFLNAQNKIEQFNIFYKLLNHLEKNYNLLLEGKYTSLLDIYKKRSMIINRNVAVISDSSDEKNDLICEGKVIDIGNNLELYFENEDKPIASGRLILKE